MGGLPNEVSTVSQVVTIPTANPTLTYWIWLASEETTCGNDTGKVTVNGATVEGFTLCESTNTDEWVQHTINLSSYAGMTVTLGFNATVNATNNSNFFLDDVVIE
jgi:bacillopeptidase F (M6 metalloprotease family)